MLPSGSSHGARRTTVSCTEFLVFRRGTRLITFVDTPKRIKRIRGNPDWKFLRHALPEVLPCPGHPTMPLLSRPDLLEAALLRLDDETFDSIQAPDLTAEGPIQTGVASIDELERLFWSRPEGGRDG
jgi:hypothetical protein